MRNSIEQKISHLQDELRAQGFDFKNPDLNLEKLIGFTELIIKWNKVHDLVSQKDFSEVFDHQIIDCLAAFLVSSSLNALPDTNYVDIGSGAGLPGIVWHLCLNENINTQLCEPREKRAHFLKEVRKVLDLKNLEIVNARFDRKYKVLKETFGTLRALKPEKELLEAFFNDGNKASKLIWLTNIDVEQVNTPSDVCLNEVSYSFSIEEKYLRSLRVFALSR